MIYLYMNTKHLASSEESIFLLILAACELCAELALIYHKMG